jgi:hypothetical protein
MYIEGVLTIATTGELQRLQNLSSSDHTVEMFMGVYGVGKTIALKWVMQGLRTLHDVLERGDVTENQRIGIELYDVVPPPPGKLTSGFCAKNTKGGSSPTFSDRQNRSLKT